MRMSEEIVRECRKLHEENEILKKEIKRLKKRNVELVNKLEDVNWRG